jgi:hypothetical protein
MQKFGVKHTNPRPFGSKANFAIGYGVKHSAVKRPAVMPPVGGAQPSPLEKN